MRPFFAAPSAGATRRLLLVSYSFPPDSSIGALRWEKLIAHGAGRGWEADVIMMDPDDAAVRDDSRVTSLPAGTRLFGVRLPAHPWLTFERSIRRIAAPRNVSAGSAVDRVPAAGAPAPRRAPAATAGREDGVDWRGPLRAMRRAQLARIDHARWKWWADEAARIGIALARERSYDVVVSSGPPQMAHEAARQIAVSRGLPLVLDFRDPWAIDVHDAPADLKSETWLRISRRYEADCIAAASLVVANTAPATATLIRRFPSVADRAVTIMNGADPDVGGQPAAAATGEGFVIFQGGGLYDGRNPATLFRAVGRAARELDAPPDRLRVHFLGSTSYEGTPLAEIADAAGIADRFGAEGMVPRREALAAMSRAPMLVLLPQNEHHCIPGKTFEYVQASSWLLALAPPHSATAMLLAGSRAFVHDPADVDGIAATIVRCYQAFVRGERPVAVNSDGRFDRGRQAERLFDLLSALAPAPSPG
ncbi:MAG: hypothetical protein ACT4OZ_13525 [Gemmatimonadota bacterium]